MRDAFVRRVCTALVSSTICAVFGRKRLDEISEQDIIDFNTLLGNKPVANGQWKTQLHKKLADAESGNANLPDIVKVMGATGLRRENVLAMRWESFNEARGIVTVPAEADKAKKGFVLHLASGVQEILQERAEQVGGPWVHQ